MNEKIKQLAEQAYLYQKDDNFLTAAVENFAQLIVNECAEVARRTILKGSGVNPDTFDGTVTTVQEIKQHFGIQE